MSKNFWRLAALIMILAVCMSLAPLPAAVAGATDTLGFTPYSRISAGYLYSLAVRPDGTVAAWGVDDYGQCSGASGKTDIVSVAAGYTHALTLKSDGTVVAWGYNTMGQCDIPAGARAVAIAAGAILQ